MQRSVFEIIGPVMVGPSSSHTAGMARIGAEAARHFPGGYKKLDLCFSRRLEKTYKGHRSHIAAAGGAIGLSPDSPELKNSLLLAAEKKIDVSVSFFEEGEVPQNTLRVTFFYGDGTLHSLTAQSVGGGSIEILKIDGAETDEAPFLDYGATVSGFSGIKSITELLDKKETFTEIAVRYEERRSGRNRAEIISRMRDELSVMEESVKKGLDRNELLYGLTSGEDAKRLLESNAVKHNYYNKAAAYAIAVMEQNASMGRLVAAPTGGSAGIVPGVLFALKEEYGFSDEKLADALFTAALFGIMADERGVSFSGSVGGCQGEIGVSAAIASAAAAALFTDNKKIIANAFAMTLKNLLGLVCDPIAGPIEVPCIKRNAMGAVTALVMCDMALAGIESFIPADEVMDALKDVEERMPPELKCACVGGLACTKTACEFRSRETQ